MVWAHRDGISWIGCGICKVKEEALNAVDLLYDESIKYKNTSMKHTSSNCANMMFLLEHLW